MRERMAKAYAVGLVVLMTGLAALFADRQNTAAGSSTGDGAVVSGVGSAPRVPAPETPPDAAVVALGRVVFESQGCVRCHRVAGEGSPRSPLDGVGARRTPEELRAWIVGDAVGRLSSSVARTKVAYSALPTEEMEALVSYLTTLRD